MIEISPATRFSIRSAGSMTLPRFFRESLSIAARPKSRLCNFTAMACIAAFVPVHFLPASLKAETCTLLETAAPRNLQYGGHLAGMPARKLAEGGLFAFAAPDKESLIAGWLLENPNEIRLLLSDGEFFGNPEDGSDSFARYLADSSSIATASREIRPHIQSRPDFACGCKSASSAEPSTKEALIHASKGVSTGLAKSARSRGAEHNRSNSLSGILQPFQDSHGLRVSASSDPNDRYRSRVGQPLLPKATSESFNLPYIHSESFWFAIGNQNAPPVYAFLDPGCPYCVKAVLRLRDRVESGTVQIRVILVSGANSSSSDIVARILASQDPPSAFWKHMNSFGVSGGSGIVPEELHSLQTELLSAVERNTALLKLARIPAVPLFIFESTEGVQTVMGVPNARVFDEAIRPTRIGDQS